MEDIDIQSENDDIDNEEQIDITEIIKKKSIDDLLLDLKIIAQIKENDKMCVCDKTITIDSNYYLVQGLMRWINKESRSSTLDYIEFLLNRCFEIINNILIEETDTKTSISASDFFTDTDSKTKTAIKQNITMNVSGTPEKRNRFKDENSLVLKRFYVEMINAEKGLDNLRITYNSDISVTSRIELLLQTLKNRIIKIDEILQICIS